MAATARQNRELKQKAASQLKGGNLGPVEELRLKCLTRGASGIKGLGRYVGSVNFCVYLNFRLCKCTY